MTLTVEQVQALDELERLMGATPGEQAAPGIQSAPGIQAAPEKLAGDMLKTWLGISSKDLKTTLLALNLRKEDLERRLLDWVALNPMHATFEFLGVAAWAFYQAERGVNPRFQTYIDAFYYISTCASVGYADLFAVTQTGRAIAALVMALGPAITNKTLDRPVKPGNPS
jgi:hypothetical protein